MNQLPIYWTLGVLLKGHLRQKSVVFFCLRHRGRGEHIRMVRKIFQTDSRGLLKGCLAQRVPADIHKP